MDTDAEKAGLTYEETPPIAPEDGLVQQMAPPPKPRNNIASILTAIITFILLFVVGFWLSGIIRQYAGGLFGEPSKVMTPTPTPKIFGITPYPTSTESADIVWSTASVLEGRTRTAFPGISFSLPPDVLPLICDGSACGSQGTYLPGGTRFTVALRGAGQVLPDYRGKIISDLTGITFPVTDTTIAGHEARLFNGTFVGTTVGGYVFTRMRGYMITLTDTLSLEINHFTPRTATADFASDDTLFDQIVATLTLPNTTLEKGETPALTPTLSTPAASPQSTPSAE